MIIKSIDSTKCDKCYECIFICENSKILAKDTSRYYTKTTRHLSNPFIVNLVSKMLAGKKYHEPLAKRNTAYLIMNVWTG